MSLFLRVWGFHDGIWHLHDGISTFVRRGRETEMSLLLCVHAPFKATWAHNKEAPIYKPGGRPSPELDHMDSLSSDFQLPDLWGGVCCASHPDDSVLLWPPGLRQHPCKLVGCLFRHGPLKSCSEGFEYVELMSLEVCSHPYFCGNTYKQAGSSSLVRHLLPNTLNYATGWGVRCLLHKNRFFCHLSTWPGLPLCCLCAGDTWGGEPVFKAWLKWLSVLVWASGLRSLTLHTKEISSVISRSLKCVESCPKWMKYQLVGSYGPVHSRTRERKMFHFRSDFISSFDFEVTVETTYKWLQGCCFFPPRSTTEKILSWCITELPNR